MPLSVASTSVNGRDSIVYTNQFARTDTTAKELFKLPQGTIPMSISLYGETASNAGTSALVSFGSTGTASYFAADLQLKTGVHAVLGQSTPSTVANLAAPLEFDTFVTATYSEHGTASTAGGPWTVVMTVLKA